MNERLLSKNVKELDDSYTVVVIGSGYGAGVAASRLSRAGQSVAVLERGREIQPGEYPKDLNSAQQQMQIDTSEGKIGAVDGMFNLHINPDMVAVVGCGLGGTSLINANVALEIDTRLFDPAGYVVQPDDTKKSIAKKLGITEKALNSVNKDKLKTKAATEAGKKDITYYEAGETVYPPRISWPSEFRKDQKLLESAYDRAREMLDAKSYPSSYPHLNKLEALEKSATAMKQKFYRPPIAVNFEDQINPFGVEQPKCVGCGDCCSGCNFGAKNTTLMNYLPDAVNHGANIFTGAHVDWIEKSGDKWCVHYTPYDSNYGTEKQAPSASVMADIVMLGAGSLGSTEILLRSKNPPRKARGLSTSSQLGHHFSGNGDVLAFGYDCYWQEKKSSNEKHTSGNINGIGIGTNDVPVDKFPGPCITGVIDMRGLDDAAADARQGLVIEEGVIPGALATAIVPAMFFGNALGGNFFRFGIDQAKSRLLDAAELGNAIMDNPSNITERAYSGPTARTQTYLVMSVDDAGGKLDLDKDQDRLRISWKGAGSSSVIARDNDLIKQATEAISGQFFQNPISTEAMGQQLVTVHPVGGCGMGDNAEAGVTNHKCQVFSSKSGTAVHDGLYVCDGAVLPGAVGVNPLLTITAVAERACELLIAERGWTFNTDIRSPENRKATEDPLKWKDIHPIPVPSDALSARMEERAKGWLRDIFEHALGEQPELISPAFEFTETMHGWVSTDEIDNSHNVPANQRIIDDYELATAHGREKNTRLDFKLTIATSDLTGMIKDPGHPARITGEVNCAALSDRPMRVQKGTGSFKLLPVDIERVETWTMTYDMLLDRESAGPVHFHGYKVLHQKTGSNAWADVTTLFVTIHDTDKNFKKGPLLARGILTLNLQDLLHQGATIEVKLPENWNCRLLDRAAKVPKLKFQQRLLVKIIQRLPKLRDATLNGLLEKRTSFEMAYLLKFAGLFGTAIFRSYGGLLSNLNNFPAKDLADLLDPRPKRNLCAPAAQSHHLTLSDGFKIKLTRYPGGKHGPVILAPGFGVRASSFAIDTVRINLVEYLTAHDYDVWLLDYRASPDSGNLSDPDKTPEPYSIDEVAKVDWPEAVSFVLEETGASDLQVLAHCVGSMSLLMALLNGMQGVRSVISSQLTLHPATDWLSYLKADINIAGLLNNIVKLNGRIPIVPGDPPDDDDGKIDTVAWNVPVPEGEKCKNPVCHRIFSVFGASYTHSQLNHWTHNALSEMFGDVAIHPFKHLALIIEKGKAVDQYGADTYMSADNVQNMALPISFIAGANNRLFYPDTANTTYCWLCDVNEPELYKFHIIEGYAHMDLFIGRSAADDVYPYLLEQLRSQDEKAQWLRLNR